MHKKIKHVAIVAFCLLVFYQVWGSFFSGVLRREESVLCVPEVLSKTGIIQTRQIKIPGYSRAFNPSLIPYEDGYLFSFRVKKKWPGFFKNRLRKDDSFLGIAKLDKNFNVLKKSVRLLDVVSYSSDRSSTAEDGRLLVVGSQIFIFFNDLPWGKTHNGFALYVGELIEKKGVFCLKEPAKPLNYAHAISIEKNWSPFESGGKTYVIYSDQPRIILEVDLNTGNCNEVTRTTSASHWNWGEIRGGTPASLVDDQSLTFFHSVIHKEVAHPKSNNTKRRIYLMGAYTFDPNPPFAIRSMTAAPLGELKDYTENNHRKVVFPGGMVIEDNLIHVAWGKNDKSLCITTFDKKALLDSMKQDTSQSSCD